jgi:hypothetical protein
MMVNPQINHPTNVPPRKSRVDLPDQDELEADRKEEQELIDEIDTPNPSDLLQRANLLRQGEDRLDGVPIKREEREQEERDNLNQEERETREDRYDLNVSRKAAVKQVIDDNEEAYTTERTERAESAGDPLAEADDWDPNDTAEPTVEDKLGQPAQLYSSTKYSEDESVKSDLPEDADKPLYELNEGAVLNYEEVDFVEEEVGRRNHLSVLDEDGSTISQEQLDVEKESETESDSDMIRRQETKREPGVPYRDNIKRDKDALTHRDAAFKPQPAQRPADTKKIEPEKKETPALLKTKLTKEEQAELDEFNRRAEEEEKSKKSNQAKEKK